MKKLLSFIMAVTIFFYSYTSIWIDVKASEKTDTPEELKGLYARSAVLIDADSGRILFEKNGFEQMPMASTTKIMTCILALELGNLDETVMISENAVKQPKVHLGMMKGQQFLLRDLLYSLMLESHNDTAVAIAEHISGSVEAFAKVMNQKAIQIGLKQTHFVTPNGLDGRDEGGIHSTTASDLALLMKYCIKDSEQREMFLEITGTKEYQFSDESGQKVYHCQNHNLFLDMMEGAISGKTGFTSKAGYCYVGALEDKNRCFIVSLLACGWPNHKNYKWSDTRCLMTYGVNHYHYKNILNDFQPLNIKVENGRTDTAGLFENVYVKVDDAFTKKSYEVLMADHENVKINTEWDSKLTAPVPDGKVVGSVTYLLNEDVLLEIPLTTQNEIKAKNYLWILWKIAEKYMLK